jgi:hypothetical protein
MLHGRSRLVQLAALSGQLYSQPAVASPGHGGFRPVGDEPLGGKVGDGVEGAWFFEQVTGAGDDLETRLAVHALLCVAVEFEHDVVPASDDQQGRRGDLWEAGPCEIGSTAT